MGDTNKPPGSTSILLARVTRVKLFTLLRKRARQLNKQYLTSRGFSNPKKNKEMFLHDYLKYSFFKSVISYLAIREIV